MIRYLIKNNLKIMGRSMTNILLFVIAPLTVIAVLSSAFSALMESYQNVDSFKVGYRLEEDGMPQMVVTAPMMQEYRKGSYVVINELFTTAANYDAQIMGKRVLDHFIGLGCTGIYVTHLKELTDEKTGVVALQAMLDENGIQTFEIRRGVSPDIACSQNQVNKYRLTYEQLKERL